MNVVLVAVLDFLRDAQHPLRECVDKQLKTPRHPIYQPCLLLVHNFLKGLLHDVTQDHPLDVRIHRSQL